MPRTRTAQAPDTTRVKRGPGRRLPADETLTPAERRAVAIGRHELASGDFVTLERLSRELDGPPRPERGARGSRSASR